MPDRVSAADPDALGVLAVALERAAADLDVTRRRLTAMAPAGASLPSLGALAAVVEWLRHQAGDVRRRAVLALSAGKGWRHQSTGHHLLRLGRAALGGLGDGVADLVRGAEAAVTLNWYAATDPKRAVRTVIKTVETMRTNDPMNPFLRVPAVVRDVQGNGFWVAAEHYVHDSAEQVPALALTVLGGAGSALPRAASNASYLTALAPAAGATAAAAPRVLRLSVPTSDASTRVALDPADGRFVVFEATGDGIAARKTSWSGLDHDDRAALEDAGIVDGKGRLRDD